MIPKGLLNGGIRESPPNGRPSVCIQEGSLFVFGFCWTGNASTATGASTVRHAARRLRRRVCSWVGLSERRHSLFASRPLPCVEMTTGEVRGEKRWPMAITLLVAVALTLSLPVRFSWGPSWIFPAIEAMLLVSIIIIDPGRIDRRSLIPRVNVGLSNYPGRQGRRYHGTPNHRPDPGWSRDEFGDLAPSCRIRGLALHNHQLRLLVLGIRRWRS